jgi:hypothetical protein
MKFAISSSLYDSASSRAQAPQAGAAEKSINKGLFWAFASASAASTSLFQLTSMFQPFFQTDGNYLRRLVAILARTGESA